ncbi:MAG: S8 family serine peptidase [Bacteroidales bacterium]|jgi:subtilisin family serine protease|nr:S8 family serine peptidase [Bacteroidales bacterium]
MKHPSLFPFLLLLFFSLPVFPQQFTIQCIDLHQAVPDGRVTEVWNGEGMAHGYSGKDVIIGVTDWGFDYTHPVFYDTLLNNYRILRAWDQFKNSGPAPARFSYGTEYIGKTALLAAQCDTSNIYGYNYHGNHVASIAAGSGGGTKYRGIAYDAELLFATFLIDEQAVVDAFKWMHGVALTEGKRLVINMSWGLYYFGNMDGTGRLAEVVDSLSNLGVVFVTSGGNNGEVNFHLEHSFSQNDTIFSRINFAMAGGTPYWGQSISMTGTPGNHFSCALKIFDNQYNLLGETPFYHTLNNEGYVESFVIVNENDTIYYNVSTEGANSYNNRPQARLRLKKPVSGSHI